MSHHQPLTVTARLQAGLAHAHPWGIALDGILAAQLHAEHKAHLHERGLEHTPIAEQDTLEDLPLPLARCTLAGEDWHWAATCSDPLDGHGIPPEPRYFSARTDPAHLEQLATTMPTNLREREGRWRARWQPTLVTICSAVRWRCVGDPDAIRALLEPVTAIGKKRAAGHGHVLSWDIRPDPDADPWQAAHLHDGTRLGRPCPPECLTDHPDTRTGGTGTAGIRPPYVHPSRRRILTLPVRCE